VKNEWLGWKSSDYNKKMKSFFIEQNQRLIARRDTDYEMQFREASKDGKHRSQDCRFQARVARNERRASKIPVHVIRGGTGAMRRECHVGKQGLRELSKLIEMLRISSYEHSYALEKRNNIMFQSRRAWDQM
jgi:hypothetical protein